MSRAVLPVHRIQLLITGQQFHVTKVWNAMIDSTYEAIRDNFVAVNGLGYQGVASGAQLVDILHEHLKRNRHQVKQEVTRQKCEKVRVVHYRVTCAGCNTRV